MELNIVIADDHGVLRAGLRSLLSSEPDFRVVGEAANGEEALRVVSEKHPHILLADLTMPMPNGIELARVLGGSMPETRVLVLSLYEDEDFALEALAAAAGAWGYAPKLAIEAELVDAVQEGGLRTAPLLHGRNCSA